MVRGARWFVLAPIALTIAFAVVLSSDAAGAVGRVTFNPAPETADAACPALPDFAQALAVCAPMAWHGAGGEWSITWS